MRQLTLTCTGACSRKALEAGKAEVQALLASAEAPSVVRLHPNAAEVYRRKVAELGLALNDDSIKAEAAEILRSLIERVVLIPAADAPDGNRRPAPRRACRRAGAERPRDAETPGRGGRSGVNCRWLRGGSATSVICRLFPPESRVFTALARRQQGSNPPGGTN